MCKSGRKTHEGPRPLNPAIESLTIGRLHALCKILPAMLGAAFDLVCSLRPLPLCGGVSGLPLYEIIGVSEALVDVVFADDDTTHFFSDLTRLRKRLFCCAEILLFQVLQRLADRVLEIIVALQTSCEKFSYNLQKRNGA